MFPKEAPGVATASETGASGGHRWGMLKSHFGSRLLSKTEDAMADQHQALRRGAADRSAHTARATIQSAVVRAEPGATDPTGKQIGRRQHFQVVSRYVPLLLVDGPPVGGTRTRECRDGVQRV